MQPKAAYINKDKPMARRPDLMVKAENEEVQCLSHMNGKRCPLRRIEGANGCYMHGGHFVVRAQERAQRHEYDLGRYQARASEFANDSEVYSLASEIGVTRMLLEQLLRNCSDDAQFYSVSPQINSLLATCEHLTLTCVDVEKVLSDHMSKDLLHDTVQVIADIAAKSLGMPANHPLVSELNYALIETIATGGLPQAAPAKTIYKLTDPAQQTRLTKFTSSNRLKSLREEIAIGRLAVEARINSAKTPADRLAMVGAVVPMLNRIGSIIKTTTKLDLQAGHLLPKNIVLAMGSAIIAVLTKHIKDQAVLSILADELLQVLTEEST